ncbi:MAG: hypothetical protein ACI849_000254 [Patiriisocius sp.]|jgi:hypothetical protein
MKNFNLYKLVMLLIVTVGMVYCVQDDDFDTPNISVVAPKIEGDVFTIMGINNAFEQAVANAADDQGVAPEDANYDTVIAELRQTEKLTFETDQITYIEGYVISNDQAGNFFDEMIMQNASSNPLGGVKVLVDVNPLFITYEVGRKVYVRLDGLTAGYDSGVFTLGILDVNDLGKITESQASDYIIRDVVVETIIAKPVLFSEFTNTNTNLFIELADAQFNRNEVLGDDRKTYAGEAGDEFDGERLLESCKEESSVIFSTSTFADFKSVLLPQGRGIMHGILTKNFFGDTFNMVVNDPTGIFFDDKNRCDPETFDCTGPSGGGTEFYSEDFEEFNVMEDYVIAGWTNVNVSGGIEVWEIGSFDNNNYAQVSGFSSGEDIMDIWLVTPGIEMDATSQEELMFNIQAAFDNGAVLSVLVSNNFMGDVSTATWNLVDATIPSGPENGFGDFTLGGPINISCVDGVAHIAFRYQGSDPTATTRYHVDTIVITGN